MKSERFESVWDAIGETPEEAQNLRLRSELITALQDIIRRKKWTQTKAAKVLGVTGPRVSDLMRDKMELFALESLVKMASAAGLRLELKVRQAKAKRAA